MQSIWAKIQAWFVSQGGWAHGLTVIYLTLIALYAGVPAFQALLNNIYGCIPSWGHQVILAVLGILAFYTSTKSLKMKSKKEGL